MDNKCNTEKKKSSLRSLFSHKSRTQELLDILDEDEYFSRTSESFGKLVAKRFFHNKLAVTGVVIMFILILSAVFAPVICRYTPEESHLEVLTNGKPLAPGKHFIWGTDDLGRDYFTRCMYGGRISLMVGFIAVIGQMLIGIPIGCIAGYFGGWVDTILMRILEVFNSIPIFLVIIIVAAGLERSVWNVIWVMAVFNWPPFVRIIRAYFLSLREQDFIQAETALGIHPLSIIVKHMLPAVAMPVLIVMSSSVVNAVLMESSLSYLGFGVMEPTPTWGSMLSAAGKYLRWAPAMSIFPGILITLVTLGMNFIADGLRDAFDPRSRIS